MDPEQPEKRAKKWPLTLLHCEAVFLGAAMIWGFINWLL